MLEMCWSIITIITKRTGENCDGYPTESVEIRSESVGTRPLYNEVVSENKTKLRVLSNFNFISKSLNRAPTESAQIQNNGLTRIMVPGQIMVLSVS